MGLVTNTDDKKFVFHWKCVYVIPTNEPYHSFLCVFQVIHLLNRNKNILY